MDAPTFPEKFGLVEDVPLEQVEYFVEAIVAVQTPEVIEQFGSGLWSRRIAECLFVVNHDDRNDPTGAIDRRPVNRRAKGTPYRRPKGTPPAAVWVTSKMFLCSAERGRFFVPA